MFKEFFLFEIKQGFKRPLIYIFFIINFVSLFFATISDNITITGASKAINVNSPYIIMLSTLMLTLVGIFMTTALINASILKDFNTKYDEILFAAPINKLGYLGGRFLGAFGMALIPFLGAFLGIALASISPWVTPDQVNPFQFISYFNAFVLAVIPNTFLVAAIVFMLAALLRSNVMSFLGAIGILVLYLTSISFSSDLNNESVAIMADALAISSYEILTKYWTIEEKNTQMIAMNGAILFNRIIWISIGMLMLVFTYFRFSFAKRNLFFQKNKSTQSRNDDSPIPTFNRLKKLPTVNINNNAFASLTQLWFQVKIEFLGVIKSTSFIILVVIAILNMSSAISLAGTRYGTGNYPVTYLIIDAIRNSLHLFLIAIAMFFSGNIIWRERDNKMNEFIDASPIPTWIPFASKLIAMIGIIAVILCAAISCGVLNQTINGYTNYEFHIYFREFLIYDLMRFTVLIVLAMMIQTLVNHKYLGYFIFIVTIIALKFAPQGLGISNNLLIYGNTPSYIYSDMNAWGIFAKGLAWFHAYWMLFASLLGIVSVLFYVRGKSFTLAQRFQVARQRFSGNIVLLTFSLLGLWVTTAGFLFYQTEVVNPTLTKNQKELQLVNYELKYKKYTHLAQPRITDIDYDLSIYPQDLKFEVVAKVIAKNKTNEIIEQIHFNIIDDLEQNISIPLSELVLDDSEIGYRIFKLKNPLRPGDSITYQIQASYTNKGIENEISTTDVVENGTFLSNKKIMPTIGYAPTSELSNNKKREKYGLPPKEKVAKLHKNCSHVCQNTYISQDADWVNVTSTINTSADQIAIAPGTLVKEWETENRKYFRYELKQPVLNFYNFISGRYEVAKDVWTSKEGEKVDVEVYYHKEHHYNVDKMIRSIKKSLTYFSNNFGKYPHQQARIIEFPRYKTFAQAFPGTMPYSESLGFIANLKEEHAIDMVFYIVAHEMAHQWWAHQVIGANVQGVTMLSESFAQYSALMVMKEEYGEDKMKQFLRYEMDKYLRGRSRETQKEMPLMYNEKQQYIHYGKGSVVMYALQNYIGENKVNEALKKYYDAVSYQEPPYTTTLEVMDYFEMATPDSLKYLLHDMFRNIVLYNNKMEAVTYKKMEDNKYEVMVSVSVEKYSADSIGNETLIPHNDFIDIGLFSSEKNPGEKYGKPISIERHRISTRDTSFTFLVDELPSTVGIDPNYLLVDRFPADNIKPLKME